MVKKAKNQGGVIDTDAFDDNFANTFNLEGVQFPSDLFLQTAGLRDDTLTVKLRCTHHLKDLRCPDGDACLKTHCVSLAVLESGTGARKVVSAAQFMPSVGLLHFSLESNDPTKAAWKCRDDQLNRNCARGDRCTFLHQFEAVQTEKTKAEKELVAKKRTLEAAKPKAFDKNVFPSLGGEDTTAPPSLTVVAAPKSSILAKPTVADKNTFPSLSGLSSDALDESASSTSAKSSGPNSTTAPKPFIKAALTPAPAATVVKAPPPPVAKAPSPAGPTATKAAPATTPAAPQPASVVKAAAAPAPAPAATKAAAIASKVPPPPPPASPPAYYHQVPPAPPLFVGTGSTAQPTFSLDFDFASLHQQPPQQQQQQPIFDWTPAPQLNNSGLNKAADWSMDAPPAAGQQRKSLSSGSPLAGGANGGHPVQWAVRPDAGIRGPPAPNTPSLADEVLSALWTLQLDADTFEAATPMPTDHVAFLLASLLDNVFALPPYEPRSHDAVTAFTSVLNAALEMIVCYRSTGVVSPCQKLTDYVERLLAELVQRQVFTSACVSFLLNRATESKRDSRTSPLRNLLEVTLLCLSNYLQKEMQAQLDHVTILELINTCATRQIVPDCGGFEDLADRLAKELAVDVQRHDFEMKRYVKALLLPLTQFGTIPRAESYVTNVLRQVNARIHSVVKPLLKEPTIFPPAYRSFDSMLYFVEQITCTVAMDRWRLRHCSLVDRTIPESFAMLPSYDAQVYAVEPPSKNHQELWLAIEIDPRKTLSFVQWLPSLFVGQYVTVAEEVGEGTYDPQVSKEWRFTVKSVNNYIMYIALNHAETFPRHWKPNLTSLSVRVEHNHWHIDSMVSASRNHRAASFLTWAFTPVKALKAPTPFDASKGCTFNLDPEQKQFIATVIARPRLSIVVGPPGTGKTHSIVAAIEHITKHKLGRVLALASSNYAANVLASFLRQCDIDVLRIFTKSVSPRDVLNSPFANVLEYSNKVACPRRGVLVGTGGFEIDSQFVDCTASDIHDHDVICTTTAHSAWMQRAAADFAFVFVDEAGQSTFAEPLIPVTFIDEMRCTLVLAGDPRQLGPCVISDVASNHGLEQSLLGSLVESVEQRGGGACHVTTLASGYRNHPEILALFNNLFYYGRLRPGITAADVSPVSCAFQPDVRVPIVFVDVNSVNTLLLRHMHSNPFADAASTSSLAAERYDNEKEADAVVAAIMSLLRDNGNDFAKSIGVITAFRQQVLTIQAKLRAKLSPAVAQTVSNSILIGTVDQYQGQERPVIIISLVRTTRDSLIPSSKTCIGFIGNHSKTNVAISRAESLLIFVGDHAPLMRLSKQEPWYAVASQLMQRRLVVTPNEVATAPTRVNPAPAPVKRHADPAPGATAAAAVAADDSIW